MRLFIITHLALSLFSCQHEKKKVKVNSTEVKVSSNRLENVRKFNQYKKVPVMNNNDTLPYPNCYLLLGKDSLFYYRLNKKYEQHLLIESKKQGKGVHIFKDKTGDLLLFSGKNNEYCQWMRSNFEGDYEYFKLSD